MDFLRFLLRRVKKKTVEFRKPEMALNDNREEIVTTLKCDRNIFPDIGIMIFKYIQ